MSAKSTAFQKMHLQEIEQRALLFLSLDRSKEYARRRILQNLRWEFEFSSPSGLEKKVDEILNNVYRK
ncbi:MAG: hypothetical protein NTZ78_05615 [Candidatus Aureabacteria bacterium]|nr:hypothetical protein [Candidatus Auribacterota bacterium]